MDSAQTKNLFTSTTQHTNLSCEELVNQSRLSTQRWNENLAATQAELGALKLQVGNLLLQSEIKQSEYMERRAQAMLRPSMFLGARLTKSDDGWVASVGDLHVTGYCPEVAFENFDHAWGTDDQRNITSGPGYDPDLQPCF